MKKYIYRAIIILLGLIVLIVAVFIFYTSLVLIEINTTSSILLGVLLIFASTLIGGIGGLIISKFKLLD